jgi:hypothetical protein
MPLHSGSLESTSRLSGEYRLMGVQDQLRQNGNSVSKTIRALIASAALILASNGTYAAPGAARIFDIDGKVLVNRGAGFELLRETASLKTGDRIFVRKDGSATVRYLASDCEIMLTGSSMTTIDEKGPCGGGGGGLSSIFGAAIAPAQGEPDPTTVGALLVAGGAAATILLVVLLDENHKPTPVSAP